MKIDNIDYRNLLDMGFTRHEMDDIVLFRQTGHTGFVLEMEFDSIDVGISTGCFMVNEKQEWDFKLYKVSTGDTVRPIKLAELRPLINFLQAKSEEAERTIDQVEKACNQP